METFAQLWTQIAPKVRENLRNASVALIFPVPATPFFGEEAIDTAMPAVVVTEILASTELDAAMLTAARRNGPSRERWENRRTTRRLIVASDAVAFPVSRGSTTLRRPLERQLVDGNDPLSLQTATTASLI
jgi:hypothetical protein